MTSELIIDVQPQEVTIALLEDQKLVEFQKEGQDSKYSVGNIYAGKVKKIMPALNACFIEIGHEREAFLHYQDLSPQFPSLKKYVKQVISDRRKLFPMSKAAGITELPKEGSIQDVLEKDQEVIVQITKEPINTKGPRLTGEISFAGRYLVLIPFTDKVSVSSKIKSKEERARLKQLIQSLKPRNFGVIVRTVAEGKRAAELNGELSVLVDSWNRCLEKIQKANTWPVLAHEETGRTVSMLRDLFNPSYESIYVNNEDVYREVRKYVSLIAPERESIVKLYNGNVPIFDQYNVTKQIKSGQPLQRTGQPGGQRFRGKHGCRRRTGPTAETTRHGRHHRGGLHRHGLSRTPAKALRTHDRTDEARQSKALHPAAQQIRSDANHTAASKTRHGHARRGNLPHLLWQRHHQAVHPVHRHAGKQNRLPRPKSWYKEIQALRPPLRSCLHQSGISLPQP